MALLRASIRGLRRACSLLPLSCGRGAKRRVRLLRLVGRRCARPPRLPARRARDKPPRGHHTTTAAARGEPAVRNGAARERGRRRSTYEAPHGSVAPGSVSSGAESKRRRCPRSRARQSRVTLLGRFQRPRSDALMTPAVMSRFPAYRPRRLRRSEALRRLVRETRVDAAQLVQPLFVVPGRGVEKPVASMPGIAQRSVERTAEECRRLRDLGVPAVILFGVPERKDARGSGATDPEGIIPRALGAIREAAPGLLLVTDVCLCEYTAHGHCGLLKDGDVDNDPTLELLAAEAVAHARAGADVIAPSDMMDGRVGAISYRT